LQAICDASPRKIDALLRKWLRLLPHPFTGADRKAGYRYDISILQAEFATTQVLDRPVHGRLFFEQVIRENLDLGRPEEIQLIFNRRIPRTTRARFRTRVVTQEVTPSLNVYTKTRASSSITRKTGPYAPRQRSTTAMTSQWGKRLTNLLKLRANRVLQPIASCSRSTPQPRLAFSARIPSRLSTARSLPAASAPRVCASPIRGLTRFCMLFVLFRQLPQRLPRRRFAPASRELIGMQSAAISQGNNHLSTAPVRLHGLIERVPASFRTRHRLRLPCRPVLHPHFTTVFCAQVWRPRCRRSVAITTPLKRAFDTLGAQIGHHDQPRPTCSTKLDTFAPSVIPQAGLELF